MTAREQAEELRQQAIQTLLDEKKAIDGMLRTLGFRAAGAALLSNVSYDRGEPARWEPDAMKL